MAIAVFQGGQDAPRRDLVLQRKAKGFLSLSVGRTVSGVGDLTIHRITETHHGRRTSLLTLGHAAEYAGGRSLRYSTRKTDPKAEAEAVHLLVERRRAGRYLMSMQRIGL